MLGFVKFSALLVFLQAVSVSANVIGIDFASDSVKVALVKPGTPLEIVNNFQSKRKTPTCITFYRGERMFGADAYALMARKPELTFAKTYRMLGRTIEHPLVKEVTKQYFPYEMYMNETSNVACLKQENTHYTPEEIVAMMLQHVKDMTANFGAKGIKDCVITIPSSFTQHERQAVYTAAEIVDLNVLSLIEENTAAALNYGIDRSFDTPTAVLFYNMGAGSVQVSIASFSSYTTKEAGKNKTISSFEILGKAFDESLGGFNFDLALADLLATRFNTAWGKKASGKDKDLRDFMRPMTRLRLEANKVKEVLSANNEYPVKAEQLHADVDLVTKVTRAEFEEACKDLLARVTLPIDRALAMANLTVKDLHSVELLGGGVRMPRVKKLLDDYFKASAVEVGQHLNGDEAMALGAAFRAANLSTAFRVRKVGLSDISTYGVSVRLETLNPSGEEDEKASGGLFGGLFGGKKAEKKTEGEVVVDPASVWTKFTPLYPSKSVLPSKSKTVAFQYDKDISCKVEYDDTVALTEGTNKLLAVYNITGVADFAKETAEKGLGQPKVHLTFGLDGSGITHLIKAEATVELPVVVEEEEPVVDSSNSTAADATNSTATDATDADADSETATETDAKKKPAKPAAKKDKKPLKKEAKKPKDNMLRKTLTIKINRGLVTPSSWSPAMVAESRSKLRALQDADELRKANAAALNDLEAYIYKVKNRILDDEDKLKAVSTEEQRQEVVDIANAAEEWLYENGDQTVAVFKAKEGEIKVKAVAIFNRFSELTKRPEAVTKARGVIANVTAAVSAWADKMPHITESEKEKVLSAIEAAEEWISEKEALQAAAKPYEAPVFDSSEVMAQLKPISVQVDKLMKKPKPVVEKPRATASSNSTGNSTDTEAPEVIRVEVNTNSTESATHIEDEQVLNTDTNVEEEAKEPAAKTEEQDEEESIDDAVKVPPASTDDSKDL